MHEIILINISGRDKPGLTSAITSILSKYEVNILDIGQAVIHNTLSLGALIEIPDAIDSAPVLKDILFSCHSLGVTVGFSPVTEETYASWVKEQGKPRYILTLLARRISAEHIARVSAIVSTNELNIDKISRLSGRIPLEETPSQTKACVEFSLRGHPVDPDRMREDFFRVSEELGLDIAFHEDNIFRRHRRLVVFDMDSTLIKSEVVDELAKRAHVGDKVSAITKSAMQGEIDFNESLKKRVALLRGLEEKTLNDVAQNLELTEGAEKLLTQLKALKFKTAILSGGFTYFAEYLQEKLGIDYVYSNELEIEGGRLTGNIKGEIVDGKRKAEIVKEIAQKEGFRLEQVIAVGDGANDLPMLATAGLGIAFHAKPIVRENARHAISTLGLDAILYLMGMRDRESLVE